MKDISNFTECPHCGSQEGYYVRLKVTGNAIENHNYDGSLGDNTHIHDNLSYTTRDKFCYCIECGEKIGSGSK